MRKKVFIIIATMLFGGNCVMQAQNEKDEIIVTDNDGKEETIDLPEAMNYEVDSLLNLYYSKLTYSRTKTATTVTRTEITRKRCTSSASAGCRTSWKCHTTKLYRNSSTDIPADCAIR